MSAYSGSTNQFFAAESTMGDGPLSPLFSPLPSPPPPTEAGEPVEAVEAGVNDLAPQVSPFSAPFAAGSVESDSAMSSLFSPPPSPSHIADETTATTIGDENDLGYDYSDDSALSPLFSAPPSPSPVSETINTAVGDENKVGDDYSEESALSPLFSPPPSPSPVEASATTSARSRSPSLPPIAPIVIPTTKPASEKVYLGLPLPGIRGPTVPAQVGSTQLEKPSEKVHLGLRMPGIRIPALLPNAQPEKTCDKSKPKARSSAHATNTNIFKATGGQDPGMEKKRHVEACKQRQNKHDDHDFSALASLFTSPAEGVMNDVIDLTLIDSPPSSPSPVCLSTPVNTSSVVGQRDSSSDKSKAKARSSAHANMSNTIKASGSQSPSGDKKTHAKGCKRKSNSCEYCKRRQIKCDRDDYNACTACLKKGTDCVYNIVPGKRGALKASQEAVAMGRTLSGSLINGGLPSTPRLSSSPSSNASVAIHTPPRAAPATSTVVVPAYLYPQLASTSSVHFNIVAAPSAPAPSFRASHPSQLPVAPVATGPEVNLEGEFDFDFDQFYRDIGLVASAPEAAPVSSSFAPNPSFSAIPPPPPIQPFSRAAPIAPLLPAADEQRAAVSQQQWTLAQWCRDNGIDEATFLTNPVFQIPGLAEAAPVPVPVESEKEKEKREAAEIANIVAFFSTPEMRSFNDVGC